MYSNMSIGDPDYDLMYHQYLCAHELQWRIEDQTKQYFIAFDDDAPSEELPDDNENTSIPY